MLIKKSTQGENFYADPEIEKFRYNPYRKANRELAEKAFRENTVLDFPLHVIIEPTTRCNLQCPMCNRNVLTRPICDLDLDLYKTAIDECAEHKVFSISLYALGEPLLHPHIEEMIKYAKGKGIPYVDLSTNGTINMVPLLGTALNELIISLDGNKETFEKMRFPAKYERVLANIYDFFNMRETYDLPIVRAQVIKTPETEKIIPQFIKQWAPLFDVVYVKTLEAMSQNLGDKNISKEELEERLKNRKPCKQLWFVLTINSNGDIEFCCHSPNGKAKLGNLKDMTIKQAWDSLKDIRENHRKGIYTEICQNCVDTNW